MLKSLDPLHPIRTKAETDFGCAGNGEHQASRAFSAYCERIIRKGDSYLEILALIPSSRATPRHFDTVSRHCAHCALAFFPEVKVVLP